ncbi:hypothetical protein CIB48_g2927 [Xylaria polymorpha]|nr:hypothetical protein CIB48_g2927 [Xylaria polymorpha]
MLMFSALLILRFDLHPVEGMSTRPSTAKLPLINALPLPDSDIQVEFPPKRCTEVEAAAMAILPEATLNQAPRTYGTVLPEDAPGAASMVEMVLVLVLKSIKDVDFLSPTLFCPNSQYTKPSPSSITWPLLSEHTPGQPKLIHNMQFNLQSLLFLGLTASSVVSVAGKAVRDTSCDGQRFLKEFKNKAYNGNDIFPVPKGVKLLEFPLLTSGKLWQTGVEPGRYRVILDDIYTYIGITNKDDNSPGVHGYAHLPFGSNLITELASACEPPAFTSAPSPQVASYLSHPHTRSRQADNEIWGLLPSEVDRLVAKIPGVGRYIAGAIIIGYRLGTRRANGGRQRATRSEQATRCFGRCRDGEVYHRFLVDCYGGRVKRRRGCVDAVDEPVANGTRQHGMHAETKLRRVSHHF